MRPKRHMVRRVPMHQRVAAYPVLFTRVWGRDFNGFAKDGTPFAHREQRWGPRRPSGTGQCTASRTRPDHCRAGSDSGSTAAWRVPVSAALSGS